MPDNRPAMGFGDAERMARGVSMDAAAKTIHGVDFSGAKDPVPQDMDRPRVSRKRRCAAHGRLPTDLEAANLRREIWGMSGSPLSDMSSTLIGTHRKWCNSL